MAFAAPSPLLTPSLLAIPKPTTQEDRSPAYDKQLEFLRRDHDADYVVWGQVDAPETPHAVTFTSFMDAVRFLVFRRRLLERGAYDLDALVFVMLMLEPAVRGRKVSREAVRAQLAREYGEAYVKMAAESIGKRDGKDVYRRRDGQVFERDDIPAKRSEFDGLLQELKKVGRFPDMLRHLPA